MLDKHVEPAAVGHADARTSRGPASAAPERISSRIGIADSAPSRPKRLVPTYFVARNFSNASAALSRSRMRSLLLLGRTSGGRPRPWSGSSAAPRCPGCACTRCRSCGSRRRAARRAGRRAASCSVPATPPVRNSRSRSQIVSPYVAGSSSTGICRLLPAQRVEVGDQVAADAVDADQRGDLHLLVQHRLFAVDRVDVGAPLDGLVRHAEGVEDVVVEAVLAEQQLVHPLQEQSRSRRPG